MQVMNTLFGGGMTSKLFMQVREKLSLCYSIGSGYYGSKGLLTVNAGIDTDKEPLARQEIFAQLEACRQGDFTDEELNAAKAAILSGLRGVTDSPGAIENYYGTAVLSGLAMTVSEYMAAVESVTAEQVIAAAKTVRYHSSFFLKGVTA
jgi:predicted Zn-dependent peptidase